MIGNDTTAQATFGVETLRLDPERATRRITDAIVDQVFRQLRRKGAVVGLSGGIDSSVTAALCVRALGPERVLGVFMPERDSSDDTLDLSRAVADSLGIATVLENITGMLDAAGCYRRRDEAIRSVFPEFGPGYLSKIVLSNVLDGSPYRVFFRRHPLARRTDSPQTDAAGRVSNRRRRHEFQAARAKDAGILSR